MNGIYKEYNPNKNRKILVTFDAITGDMLSKKELNPMVTELFIWGRKLNISTAFITQSYFAAPKNIRINSTYIITFNICQVLTLKTLQKMYCKTILSHIIF